MEFYTRKSDVKVILKRAIQIYEEEGLESFTENFHEAILHHKVKFPLLEFCAKELHLVMSDADQITFCDVVCKRKTEGGNVILGILLQCRLSTHFQQSITKAREYIADANAWYVCDLIGERVFGYSLLTNFDETFIEIEKLSKDPSNWVVRSLGAGCHYAIKKGLEKKNVNQLFILLMSMAKSTDKEIRQGIGWAAKTTAKFHPDIIKKHALAINNPGISGWFRSKIKIGLNRNLYAKRKRS